MIGTMGVILWIGGLLLVLLALGIAKEYKFGASVVFVLLGVLLLTGIGYEMGRGNPDLFQDNTLYQIESDPISATYNGQEMVMVLATQNSVTLSKDNSVKQETKYYGETSRKQRIKNLKKGDIVLMTPEKAVIIGRV